MSNRPSQEFTAYKGANNVIPFQARDTQGKPLPISRAKMVFADSQEDLDAGTFVLTRDTNTAAEGTITDGANGIGEFYVPPADQADFTRLSREGSYLYQIGVLESASGDSRYIIEIDSQMWWKAGHPAPA